MKKWLISLMALTLALATAGTVAAFALAGDGDPTPPQDDTEAPNASGMCAEDTPDCIDTIVIGDNDEGVHEPDVDDNEEPPIRIDFDMDPNECNLVHNINACDRRSLEPEPGIDVGEPYPLPDPGSPKDPSQDTRCGLDHAVSVTSDGQTRCHDLPGGSDTPGQVPGGNATSTPGQVEPQPPIRSDEGIDPNECNWVHNININTCKGNPTIEDPPLPKYEDWVRDHATDGATQAVAEVWAPIEDVEVLIRESFPPQYAVHIVSGLPGGCAEFDQVFLERDGDTFWIEAYNLEPASGEVACTMIYGYVENVVELGSDLEPGKSYTVVVNDVTKSFVAQ